MQEWLQRPGRKPLILRGARQVGKSTLVRLFCDAATDRDLLTVNLERHPDLAETFARNDPGTVLGVIEAVSNGPRSERTILFLDEIQAAPSAFAALRYFFEEVPELPIVAAGSLMEFMLSNHSFSMPVGRVQYLDLGPMTFTEFLRAVGQNRLAREIETFEWTTGPAPPSPPPVLHRRLLELLRLYHFVGGMPEAVKAYAESASLGAVRTVHASIIDTWRDDFPKYASRRDLTRMLRVFNFAARHAGRKVKYSNVSPDDQSATIRRDMDLLAMARVIARVTHSQCSGLPLQADLKEKVFKLIFLAAGGPLQQCRGRLRVRARRPHRPDRSEGRTHRHAEVAAPVRGGEAVPFAVRFDADPPALHTVEAEVRHGRGSERIRYPLLSLPLYLVERLPSIVAGLAARM